MSLFVLSDLHIWGPEDPIYQSLLTLLREKVRAGDSLVFAGDVFDVFVGNKRIFKKRYSAFIQLLAEVGSRGVQSYYIEGNHDFLIRKAFEGIQGLTIHPDSVTATISGKRFFFAHGDTVDRSDIKYRLLRSFFRSGLMKLLVYLAPDHWLDRFGQISSKRSREKRQSVSAEIPLQKREFLRRSFRSYAAEQLAQGFDFVVMGHCHDLDEMTFNIGGRLGQYVNVGYPRVHGSFLSWSPGEDRVHREKMPRSEGDAGP